VVGPSQTVRAYVGLGSNLGDREASIRRAAEMLGRRDGILVMQVSSFMETDPVGGPPGQGKFLNAAAALDTTLSPQQLLVACMKVERELGRARGPDEPRWGARPIDIDILLYGDEIVRERDLEIPHPRMHKREFVLRPLAEIAPDARHPVMNVSVAELLGEVPVMPEGAVAAYLRMRCDDAGYDAVRSACEEHESIVLADAVRLRFRKIPSCPEEAFMEVFTTLALRDFMGFCDTLAKKLDDGAEAPAVAVLLYGTEQDADFGIPHPSLHDGTNVLRSLKFLAPYAWVPGAGMTAGELLEARETASRQFWLRGATDPGRN